MRRRYTAEYYEALGFKTPSHCQRNVNRLREIMRYKQGGRLLEVGCGLGSFLEAASERFEVEGIDISEYAVAVAKSHVSGRISLSDIEKLELTPDAHEVVVMFNVLEHLQRPGVAIANAFHSLTQGGLMVGSVPNNSGVVGAIHTWLTNVFDATHRSTYPPSTWQALFRDAGFRVVRFLGEVMLGPTLDYLVRGKLWKYVSFNVFFVCIK